MRGVMTKNIKSSRPLTLGGLCDLDILAAGCVTNPPPPLPPSHPPLPSSPHPPSHPDHLHP